MKAYNVDFITRCSVFVEAESEDEALEAAEDLFFGYDGSIVDSSVQELKTEYEIESARRHADLG